MKLNKKAQEHFLKSGDHGLCHIFTEIETFLKGSQSFDASM